MSDDATGSATAERGLGNASHGVASFDEDAPSPLRRIQQFFHQNPTAIPAIILIVAVVIFAFVTGGKFFGALNLSLILAQVTLIALLGTAQTLVIITAGIDLSVGAIMVLSSIIMGKLAVDYQVPVVLAFPIGLLTGLLCGLANGILVTALKLPPFIVTLGTWSIYGALITLVSNAATIRSQALDQFAPFLKSMGARIPVGGGAFLMYGSILMIAVAALVWYMLSRTAFGRHVYAIGDDSNAARLSGIQVNHTLVGVYAIAGLLCGIAGWVLIGRVGAVSPLGNQTANLDAITAVVIGGTSLFGGRGSIVGTLFGALIVGVFDSGLSLTGVDPLWRQLTVGALIIIAVAIDQWIRRVSA
ncbi:ABC transporter permease [Devosia soli]|uniref:ABC transporter permease n=1 Tax=Devosia soli TaxID=361041 RepID=A0A0F5L756_9HYPH|nr:ABC transporter permease [Devosia soli]KKB78236.1 ABC transporter permease [Devosia soli]